MQKQLRIKQFDSEIKKQLMPIINDMFFLQDKNIIFSITKVTLNNEYSVAKIYAHIYSNVNKSELDNIWNTIVNNTKKIRFELAKKIKMRAIPELIFIFDDSINMYEKINNLLKC